MAEGLHVLLVTQRCCISVHTFLSLDLSSDETGIQLTAMSLLKDQANDERYRRNSLERCLGSCQAAPLSYKMVIMPC